MWNNLLQTHLKLSKIAIQKTAEATGDLIGNKIVDALAELYNNKITKVSRASSQISSETVRNETESIEHDKEIAKKIYISPEERQNSINDLRII